MPLKSSSKKSTKKVSLRKPTKKVVSKPTVTSIIKKHKKTIAASAGLAALLGLGVGAYRNKEMLKAKASTGTRRVKTFGTGVYSKLPFWMQRKGPVGEKMW